MTSTTGTAAARPALAVFEWIETWYDQSRRLSSIQMLSPIAYENLKATAPAA